MTVNTQKIQMLKPGTLLLLAFLFFSLPVAAINLTVTGDIQNWALTPGSDNEDAHSITLNVSSANSSWTVSVVDNLDGGKNSTSAGKMLEYNSTTGWINAGNVLTNYLRVLGGSGDGITGSPATLGSGSNLIETGFAPADEKQMNITVQQQVTASDPRLVNGSVYRVVLTFIGGET
ncbi:MAG: hypothetical protein ABFC24_04860 [Methanoregulaceae archaeon]